MEKVTCTNCGTENTTDNKYCSNCGFKLPKSAPPVVESTPIEADTFTSKINKRRGLFGAVLGIFLFVLVILLFKHLFFGSSMMEKFKSSAIDKAMVAMVQQLNKSCPVTVDQYTRLDNITSLPGRTLQYNFTLAVNKADVNADALKEEIEPKILDNIKANPQMQLFRTYKATFDYNYRDKSGETLLTISITPDMYVE